MLSAKNEDVLCFPADRDTKCVCIIGSFFFFGDSLRVIGEKTREIRAENVQGEILHAHVRMNVLLARIDLKSVSKRAAPNTVVAHIFAAPPR